QNISPSARRFKIELFGRCLDLRPDRGFEKRPVVQKKQSHQANHFRIGLFVGKIGHARGNAPAFVMHRARVIERSVDIDLAASEPECSIEKVDQDPGIRSVQKRAEVLCPVNRYEAGSEKPRKAAGGQLDVRIKRFPFDRESPATAFSHAYFPAGRASRGWMRASRLPRSTCRGADEGSGENGLPLLICGVSTSECFRTRSRTPALASPSGRVQTSRACYPAQTGRPF